MQAYELTVESHVSTFFEGHRVSSKAWEKGPMRAKAPSFRVLEVAPGPKSGCWNYVSVGAGLLSPKSADRIEFLLAAPSAADRAVELVTMAAWYHYAETLGLGHTLPIGEPWLPGSKCDGLLVSLPYPYGPGLERVTETPTATRILWLLPITGAEREFAIRNGQEALEKLFDLNRIEYWAPSRAPVVPGAAG